MCLRRAAPKLRARMTALKSSDLAAECGAALHERRRRIAVDAIDRPRLREQSISLGAVDGVPGRAICDHRGLGTERRCCVRRLRVIGHGDTREDTDRERHYEDTEHQSFITPRA